MWDLETTATLAAGLLLVSLAILPADLLHPAAKEALRLLAILWALAGNVVQYLKN